VEAYRVVRRRGYHIVDTIGSQIAVRSVLRASCALPPRKIPSTGWYRLGQLQGHSAPGRIRKIEKNVNALIRNGTLQLPDCSRVPQPTTLPRVPPQAHSYTKKGRKRPWRNAFRLHDLISQFLLHEGKSEA
jgi:hypothetical protein